jgi:hypothetical protein
MSGGNLLFLGENMDQITESYIKDFLKNNQINSISPSEDFEKFSNYCLIYKEYKNTQFELDDISTGKSQGIDGIGVIVNGELVNEIDEIEDLVETNRYLEASFIFIQSKTSTKFEGSEIGNFIFSIKDFFSSIPSIRNEDIDHFLEIKTAIYDKSPNMSKGKPICKIYYVTTGEWNESNNLRPVIEQGRSELKATNYFKEVYFEPCGASLIQEYYRKTKEIVQTTFNFKDKITLPDIEGISESYLGIIPFNEFKKIIIDDSGNIRNIFYDNVRDYLGSNPINTKINSTFTNKKFDLFCILNNGVTVVADRLVTAGNKFTISDFQIVNGCQTSHVIYNNRDLEGIEDTNIPLRLIVVSGNEDTKNSITIATNSQTEVAEEQLQALSTFQKNLEEFYKSFEGSTRLFYERRKNQYNNTGESKTRIITIGTQIKAFTSMFQNLPYLSAGYFGSILKKSKDKIFEKDHQNLPYYTSAYAYYKLWTIFHAGNLDRKYKKAKYHMLMLFKLLILETDVLPPFNSKKINETCNKIIAVLNDPSKSLDYFKETIKIIDEIFPAVGDDKYPFKLKEKNEALLEHFNKKYKGKKLVFV